MNTRFDAHDRWTDELLSQYHDGELEPRERAALSEALRVELTGTGITVTLVYPISTTETEFREAEVQKVRWRPMGPAQSAERVARSILRCVRRPRPEVYPYWPVRILAAVSVIAPGLVDRGMRRVLQRRPPVQE